MLGRVGALRPETQKAAGLTAHRRLLFAYADKSIQLGGNLTQ